MTFFIKVKKWIAHDTDNKLFFLFALLIVISLCLSFLVIRHYYEKKIHIYEKYFTNSLNPLQIDNPEELTRWTALHGGLFFLIILGTIFAFRFASQRFVITPHNKNKTKVDEELSVSSDKNISEDVEKLELLANTLEEKLKNDSDTLLSLHSHIVKFKELSQELINTTTIESALKLVTDRCRDNFNALFAGIWLETGQQSCDEQDIFLKKEVPDKQLKLKVFSGHEFFEKEDNIRLIAESFDFRSIVTEQKKIEINSITKDNSIGLKQWIDEQGIQSFAIYPLVFSDETYGVFALISKKTYTEAEFQILEVLTRILSVVISNFRLNSEIGTLKKLVFPLDVRKENKKKTEVVDRGNQFDSSQSRNILLVEDNDINKKLCITILENAGYQVDTADNGLEAFRAFKTKRYALIVMDLNMPIMPGCEATKKIRHWESVDEQLPGRIPIIAVTAHVANGYRKKCLDMGFDDFITKPIRSQEFLKKVTRLVNNGSTDREHSKETQKEPSEVLIDMEDVLNRFQGDRSFLYDMLNEFLIYAPQQLKNISQSFNGGDYKSVATYVHSLKGAANNLGVKKLVSLCLSLEQIECNKEQKTAKSLMNQMEGEIEELKKYCHTFQCE